MVDESLRRRPEVQLVTINDVFLIFATRGNEQEPHSQEYQRNAYWEDYHWQDELPTTGRHIFEIQTDDAEHWQ
jgi:hypothetical protein